MKKILILVLLFLSISCENNKNSFEGEWNATSPNGNKVSAKITKVTETSYDVQFSSDLPSDSILINTLNGNFILMEDNSIAKSNGKGREHYFQIAEDGRLYNGKVFFTKAK